MNYNDSNRIYAALHKETTPDKAQTIGGWQNRCQLAHRAVMQFKAEHQERISDLQKTYVSELAQKKAESEWATVQEVIDKRACELQEDLKKILDGKREQFKRIGLTAPDEETLRLLQTLSLRDDLSEGEVSRIGEGLVGNFQALRALRSIARKSNISMPAPPTPEQFEDALSRAEEYATEMLRLLDEDDTKMGYHAKCFYSYSDIGTPKLLFGQLDSCLCYAVQVEQMEDTVDAAEASE